MKISTKYMQRQARKSVLPLAMVSALALGLMVSVSTVTVSPVNAQKAGGDSALTTKKIYKTIGWERIDKASRTKVDDDYALDLSGRLFFRDFDYTGKAVKVKGEIDFRTEKGPIPGLHARLSLLYADGEFKPTAYKPKGYDAKFERSANSTYMEIMQQDVAIGRDGRSFSHSFDLGPRAKRGLIPGQYVVKLEFMPALLDFETQIELKEEIRIWNKEAYEGYDSPIRTRHREALEDEQKKEREAAVAQKREPILLTPEEMRAKVEDMVQDELHQTWSKFIQGQDKVPVAQIAFFVSGKDGEYFVDDGSRSAAVKIRQKEISIKQTENLIKEKEERLKEEEKEKKADRDEETIATLKAMINGFKERLTIEQNELIAMGGELTNQEISTFDKIGKDRQEVFVDFMMEFEAPFMMEHFRLIYGDFQFWEYYGKKLYGENLYNAVAKNQWPWEYIKVQGEPLGTESKWKKYLKDRLEISVNGDPETWYKGTTTNGQRRTVYREKRGGYLTKRLQKQLDDLIDEFDFKLYIKDENEAEGGERKLVLNNEECMKFERNFISMTGIDGLGAGLTLKPYTKSKYIDESKEESTDKRLKNLDLRSRYGQDWIRYPSAYGAAQVMYENIAYMPTAYRYYILRWIQKGADGKPLGKAVAENQIGDNILAPKIARQPAGTLFGSYVKARDRILDTLQEERNRPQDTPIWWLWTYSEGFSRNYPQNELEQEYIKRETTDIENMRKPMELPDGEVDPTSTTKIITSEENPDRSGKGGS